MSIPSRDFLIIGAGLAGQFLAKTLAERGCSVTLMHDPARQSASSIAAWMINPITGIRFVPSWGIEKFLPFAVAAYQILEQESSRKIWHPQRIVRLFQGEDEIPRWAKKRDLPTVTKYLGGEFAGSPEIRGLHHDLGGLYLEGGGWADLQPWLQNSLLEPPKNVRVMEGFITPEDLRRSGFQVHGTTFAKAIFCTGFDRSPLPWKAAKGELLTVKIPGLRLNEIILRGIFLIPLGDDTFRLGATYEWEDLSLTRTQEAADFLSEKLAALIDLPFEIIDAQTAIRPILQDARPIVGMDMSNPRLGYFNGFGSKAGLTVPWLAEHFVEHLLDGADLDREVSLERLRE